MTFHMCFNLSYLCTEYLQIVPGYYLRWDTNGQIENSAAVNNTASEHFMVDRLIVDDLLNWAVNYKVSCISN
jgi:pullulanase/glycogen debranching enzyme